MYYSANTRGEHPYPRVNQPDTQDHVGQGSWAGCLSAVGGWRSRFDRRSFNRRPPVPLAPLVHLECSRMETHTRVTRARRRVARRRLTSPSQQRWLVSLNDPGYEDRDSGVCARDRAGEGSDETDADIIALAGS